MCFVFDAKMLILKLFKFISRASQQSVTEEPVKTALSASSEAIECLAKYDKSSEKPCDNEPWFNVPIGLT